MYPPGTPLTPSNNRSYFTEAQVRTAICTTIQIVIFNLLWFLLQTKYEMALWGNTEKELGAMQQALELASLSCTAFFGA
jgi:hypothetical protein